MNIQVSYDAIIDGCAMACVLFTEKEIDKMLLGEKPLHKSVAKVIHRLANDEPIELSDPPLRAKNKVIDQAKETREMLHYLVSQAEYTRNQLAEIVKLSPDRVSDLMGSLRRKGLVRCSSGLPANRLWSAIRAEDGGVWMPPRQRAQQNGDQHYEGSIHKRCGTTLRLTSNGECASCKRERSSIRRYSNQG